MIVQLRSGSIGTDNRPGAVAHCGLP